MTNGQQSTKPQNPRPEAIGWSLAGHWPLGVLLALGPWALGLGGFGGGGFFGADHNAVFDSDRYGEGGEAGAGLGLATAGVLPEPGRPDRDAG